MKILLVGINSKFIHSNLAIRYLNSSIEDLKTSCTCEIEEFSINDNIEHIVRKIIEQKANIVGFSTYIWNVDFVLKISQIIKLISPNTQILYGGPEVSFDSEEFLRSSKGDIIIEGEGEATFYEFIKCKINNENVSSVRGLYIKNGEEIIYTGRREFINMNDLPFPYDKEEDLKNKIIYYEASRGCPFNCKYCLSSTTHGVRFLEIERVKKELEILSNRGVKLIKFVDRTFNCNKDFTIKIWEYLIQLDTNATFHFEISGDLFNEEELQLLKKAPKGRFQFEVGIQTTNEEILKNIDRIADSKKIFNNINTILHFNNINQHLDLIAGLPGENLESLEKSFNDLYRVKPQMIQLGFLKLLRGSKMRDEALKWGIVYSPFPPYEVLYTKDLSYDELIILKRTEAVLDKYYNSGKFTNILKFFIELYSSPFKFYKDLGEFFYRKGYFDRKISFEEYYKVFIEFNAEITQKSEDLLKEIIKYDFLSFNMKKYIPEFLSFK